MEVVDTIMSSRDWCVVVATDGVTCCMQITAVLQRGMVMESQTVMCKYTQQVCY